MITNLVKSVIVVAGVLLLVSCGTEPESPREKAVKEIKRLEKRMHDVWTVYPPLSAITGQVDPKLADSALLAYDDFVKTFPTDSISADLLFKGAEIATATKAYDRALAYYKEIDLHYPKYKLYPESLFLQASLLDNYIDRDGEALMVYKKVIKQFPGTSYARDAESAIRNLGKSDQELIEEFKKKNN